MPDFIINSKGITVTDDAGTSFTIQSDNERYTEAVNAALGGEWSTFLNVFATTKSDDEDVLGVMIAHNVEELMEIVRGLLGDEVVTPAELGLAYPEDTRGGHEHDLSQWNGSPIYYPTREMARSQSDRWGMFWEYHDFGIASPTGYRYATVPIGVGPTAPEGYDWVCLPREEV